MNKKIIIAIATVVAAAALFVAGAYAGPRLLGIQGAAIGAPDGTRGPMGQLTDEERAQVEGMSDSERQAFFQEKMGANAPAGAAGRMGGPGGQRVIEGEIASVASDQITIETSGGSQVVYFDEDTVVAIAEGATATKPATGGKVSAVVTPETDNVLAASILVLQ